MTSGEVTGAQCLSALTLRSLSLANRLVVSPMAQYMAQDGTPGDWHVTHLGMHALGGAGLVVAEMTCVSPEARITPGCPGLWNEAQQSAWRRITDFVHAHTPARIGVQLGHAGRKGSTRPLWEGFSRPLAEGNWPLVAPSPVPWSAGNQVPREASEDGLTAIAAQHGASARRAVAAGFDLIELHFAHGYLASSFLSPLSNRRQDCFGGSLENRLRFPLMILRAVRDAVPDSMPVTVRISCSDWIAGGFTPGDAVQAAIAFRDAGCDLIVASSGQTDPQSRPPVGPMWQVPFARRIREEAAIATMAVGGITVPEHAEQVVTDGSADLVAVGRAALYDPWWARHWSHTLGAPLPWPPPYAYGGHFARRHVLSSQSAQGRPAS
ncbi:MAG TPA: tRNA-dihydrouridine synthase [Acetobacteraceae bacterium]|nr:tRNA-dihydrouridine synthase [Acetobacteraceae bacterium]